MAAEARRPAKRADRRRPTRAAPTPEALRLRRSRLVLLAGGAASALVLAAWFPASALLHQHDALASTNAQLKQLRSQDQALSAEQKRLSNSSEIENLARQEYQLVLPGQHAYEVLPPSGAAGSSAFSGDPGNQPVAAPNGVDPGTATSSGAGSRSSGSASTGLLGRIARTLEFWH